MLRAILIGPDALSREQLEEVLGRLDGVRLMKRLDHYPSRDALARLVRAQAPDLLLLSFESPVTAAEVAGFLEADFPAVQIAAFHRQVDPEVLIKAMRAGAREYLSAPFQPETVRELLARIARQLERTRPDARRRDHVFAFLPSKPGVGASTIALNTSLVLAQRPENSVLVADFDLYSGAIAFMLKLESTYTITDATARAHQLDEDLWPQLVTKADRLDVLPSGALRGGMRVAPGEARHLVEFARRLYNVICVDLAGGLEEYAVELLQEAGRIFLVCTPELASLRLGRDKLEFLRALELESKVHLLLNRATRRGELPRNDIEKILGLPVYWELPNDYTAVSQAIYHGKPAANLTKWFATLADRIMDQRPAAQQRRRRFVEYFSILPARDAFRQ